MLTFLVDKYFQWSEACDQYVKTKIELVPMDEERVCEVTLHDTR